MSSAASRSRSESIVYFATKPGFYFATKPDYFGIAKPGAYFVAKPGFRVTTKPGLCVNRPNIIPGYGQCAASSTRRFYSFFFPRR